MGSIKSNPNLQISPFPPVPTNNLGCFFQLNCLYLRLKSNIKYNFINNKVMLTLRTYLVGKMILALLPLFTIENMHLVFDFMKDIPKDFQLDCLMVLAMTGFVSKFVTVYFDNLMQWFGNRKNDLVYKQALNFITTAFVLLCAIDCFYEDDYLYGSQNLELILIFVIFHLVFMYTYTSCWSEAILNGNHFRYLSTLVCQIGIHAGLAIVSYNSDESVENEQFQSEYYDDEYFVYVIDYEEPYYWCLLATSWIGFMLPLMCLFGIISILVITALMWKEESNEKYQRALMVAMIVHTTIESVFSLFFFVCTIISRNQFEDDTTLNCLCVVMAFLNLWSSAIDRGYYTITKLYKQLNDVSATKSQMKPTEELKEPQTCKICDDVITEDGVLTECDHHFHSYCLRDFIVDEKMLCPNCQLQINLTQLAKDDTTIQEELAEQLVFKMVEKMKKFNEDVTFFSEKDDLEQHGADGIHSDLQLIF